MRTVLQDQALQGVQVLLDLRLHLLKAQEAVLQERREKDRRLDNNEIINSKNVGTRSLIANSHL